MTEDEMTPRRPRHRRFEAASAARWMSGPDAEPAEFEDPEGLRALLQRLHAAGPGAWKRDPDAAALMAFTGRRYARLAMKYGQAPDDAAAAAFEAMLIASTRNAADPWAVVTSAVRITLIAEYRANGLLTSAARARRAAYSVFHDAERFSDHETDLTEYHPAFRIPAPGAENETGRSNRTDRAARDVAEFLSLLGWDPSTVRHALDYVCSRLPDFGDRVSAYDALRRDKSARVLLDLPHEAWIGLLRLILGNPTGATGDERWGLLARLLIEETVADLLTDRRLVTAAVRACPSRIVRAVAGR